MQTRSKHTFVKSKMNKDLDARLISAGEYRDANNVSVSRSEGADVGALENILGNEFLNNLQTEGTTPYQVIGWHIDQTNDRIFVFCTNYEDNSSNLIDGIESNLEQTFAPYNSLHKIVYFNTKTNTSATIVSGRFLNFSVNSLILNTNMIENLLFFTDNRNQPRKINVDTAIEDPTYYYSEDHISVAKYYPYQPVQLYDELVISNCIYIGKNTADGRPNPASPLPDDGYSGIYDYFLIPTTTAAIISLLKNNIGVKAYVTVEDESWEFRVAYFQQDGVDISGGTYSPVIDPLQTLTGYYLIFVDRDLSSAGMVKYGDGGTPFPQSFPSGMTGYDITIVYETSKDVSNPWFTEDIGKYTIGSFPAPAFIGVGDAATTFSDTPINLYAYGTRSLPVAPGNTQYSGFFNEPGNDGTTIPSFFIKDAFPDNAAGISRNAYTRIKHNKIPETDYIVIVEGNVLPIPSGSAGDPGPFTFNTKKYDRLENGGQLTNINLNSVYGIAVGDTLTAFRANKYYNSTFPGDPTFLEDKFVRFSYRFRYDDGEYSIIAPFSQSVFIPKQDGFFLKNVTNTTQDPDDDNSFLPQEQLAGQNTVVDFMVNKITEVNVKIPLPGQAGNLQTELKVQEIDVIYKESDGLSLKVVETLDVQDFASSTENFITYKYQSRKPIKTLPSSEISRVYDNVPVRALTQSTSGNRIIYGNFVDRHTSPLTLEYMVGVSPKFNIGDESESKGNVGIDDIYTEKSIIQYPTHSLKHNRNYQVGIVLSDRYGRQSDVILSNIEDQTVVENVGSQRITFGGSTIYVPYKTNVLEPNTVQSDIVNTKSPNGGILTWPGDSIKLRWNTAIPSSITSNPGYPGLYEEVITNLQFDNTAGSTWSITTASEVAKTSGIEPGMYMRWIISNVTYETEVKGVTDNSPTSYTIEPVSTANPPTASSTQVIFYKKNTLGWMTYKVVVKQNEQDYYNVYLPSLLDGNPVVKPFKLNIDITAEGVGTVNSTTDLPAAEPKTFLLLEGMVFTSAAGTEYVITNILNNDNFTVKPATLMAAEDIEFTTRSSKSTLNVTTLLTDNANKVPPALIETTPVQQQYGTSDINLIPRVALQANYTASGGSFFPASTDRNRYIFPGITSSKVRSLGNFEGLFTDGSYAGLWQAETDPPTAVIENKLQLGQNAETVLPVSKQPLQFSCYETTPTISELDIYYETSTVLDIYTLNAGLS